MPLQNGHHACGMGESLLGIARPIERFGNAIRRSPYWALVGTTVCLLIIWDTSRRYIDGSNITTRSWLNWVVLAYIVYGVVSVLVIVPRIFAPRAPAGAAAYLSWIFALTPSVVSSSAGWLGASEWVAIAGLGASFLLLVALARGIAVHRK